MLKRPQNTCFAKFEKKKKIPGFLSFKEKRKKKNDFKKKYTRKGNATRNRLGTDRSRLGKSGNEIRKTE